MKGVGPGEKLLSLLLPSRCLLCGEIVPAGEPFCAACERLVPKEPCTRLFSLPGSGAAGFRVLSPLPYTGGYQKTLYRFKFGGGKALAKPLGRLMARTVQETNRRFDAVAWVPMTKKRKRARGYDQSQLLAAEMAKALGLPCLPLLEKIRETSTQHELSRREREKNVKGAYRSSETAAGKSLLLVDDIITTGFTLRECAEELYRAGASSILGVCAANAENR